MSEKWKTALEMLEKKAAFADELFEHMMRNGWRAPSDTQLMQMMADAGYEVPEEDEPGEDE